MKRIATSTFAIVAALALVAGCGSSNGTGGEGEAGAGDGMSASSGGSASGGTSGGSSGSTTASSGGGSGASSGGSGSGSSGSGSSSSGSGGGTDAGTFACGPSSCDLATEFCFEAGGGAVPLDGASNFTYACNPIPAQCQPTPTCACVIAADAGTHGCPCTVQPGGALLAACLYP